jgi:hypothetical protein
MVKVMMWIIEITNENRVFFLLCIYFFRFLFTVSLSIFCSLLLLVILGFLVCLLVDIVSMLL